MMAGFQRAKAEQAAIKMGIYGPPGAGKTFTTLLLAEGLAALSGKRVAYVDTERGTDFYCKAVPTRSVHPEAFDFDALYTRSLTEVVSAVRALSTDVYGVVVVDSITHLWEAAINSYSGKKTSQGGIPMHAWGKIKRPYKDLMSLTLNSPMHLFILGRQGNVFEEDEETEELKKVGVKMKAEGETPYEPHILLRMEAVRPQKTNAIGSVFAYVEKDRTGILQGRSFENPTFASLLLPIMPLLGGTQARIATDEETTAQDVEAIARDEQERAAASKDVLRTMSAKIDLAPTVADLKAIGKAITPKLKATMLPADVESLRAKYLERETELKTKAENAKLDAELVAAEPAAVQ
jgi:hypothetical protein